MFKHVFKLIWNKKRHNALLIAEMLVSFMVMFAVFSMMVNFYQNYRKPMGFEYQKVWVINIDNPTKFNSRDSAEMYYRNVRNVLKSMPEIVEVSYTGSNSPFTNSYQSTGYTYKGKKIERVSFYRADEYYKNVFNLQVLRGRWFNKQDEAAAYEPVIINESLKYKVFGNDDPIGKSFGNWEGKETRSRIIGVVADMKDKGDFKPVTAGIFNRLDTGFFKWTSRILIKVAPGAGAAFEGRLYKTVANMMKQSSVEIQHLTRLRNEINKDTLLPITILMILAAFLIINVALGLFGVLWYNINKRRGEIGLRRAVGATGNAVSGQIVVESMFLATLSLIIGAFFAVQFPLLNLFNLSASIYITAILLSVVFIYLLVLVCSLYPGRQAAAVYPAVALHED